MNGQTDRQTEKRKQNFLFLVGKQRLIGGASSLGQVPVKELKSNNEQIK